MGTSHLEQEAGQDLNDWLSSETMNMPLHCITSEALNGLQGESGAE